MTDLRGMTKVRIQGRFGGTVATATKMRIQYNTSADPNVATGDAGWATLAESAGTHTAAQYFYSAEASIATAAQVNPIQLRACIYDGNGTADPTITGAAITVYP